MAMIIEELASAIFRAQAVSTCEWEDADEDIRESCRVYARAVLPLIAAELAGVAREHHEHGDEWYRHNKMATVGQTIALAIEAHARKVGEAS